MTKVTTAAEMREADRMASERGGVPGIVLMENAGIACVKKLTELGLSGRRVAVFCGKGNNGGDGFVIARHLLNMGIETEVFLVSGRSFKGDALVNFNILEGMGAEIAEISTEENLKYKILSFDIVVDAIFGTGISGEVSGAARVAIEAINQYAGCVLSVDIPSGINADTGKVSGVAVRADYTVTLAAYKRGLLLFPGADYCGRVEVAGISIPEYILSDINTNIIDKKLAASLMPKRADNTHKGSYGKVLVIGGSKGMTGAPAMAAEAALRCGAGLVSVLIPSSLNPIMEVKLTEAMTIPAADRDGEFITDAAEEIIKRAELSDAVIFGPGIGRGKAIGEILERLLDNTNVPVVVDADGLFALAGNSGLLKRHGKKLILTPHEAEFARFGIGAGNRFEASEAFCREFGATLVLKGAKTIVTTPELKQYINIIGNNGMATAGSGDVLAGVIGAFLARKKLCMDAAVLGVYCHSAAGDAAAKRVGRDALVATDIIDAIHLILPVE